MKSLELFGFGLIVVTSFAVCWKLLKRRKKWRLVGKLAKIYIYPLKSGRFVEVPEAECTPLGVSYHVGDNKATLRDRIFIVYDANTLLFANAKTIPQLLLTKVEPKDDKTMIFSYPGKENIEVNLNDKFENATIEMYGKEKIRISDCGNKIAKWITEAVGMEGKNFRLSYWPQGETWRRDISHHKQEFEVFKYMTNKYSGAYGDISSYSLMNNSSIEELNARLVLEDRTVAVNLRPNLVIDGPVPYEEDKWHWVKIGNTIFECFRPITRCHMTTIDALTGIKNKNCEPLRTLRKYRTMKMLGEERIDTHTPVLGVYAGLYEGHNVKCGDEVYVSD